jgi:hypothetical protein
MRRLHGTVVAGLVRWPRHIYVEVDVSMRSLDCIQNPLVVLTRCAKGETASAPGGDASA